MKSLLAVLCLFGAQAWAQATLDVQFTGDGNYAIDAEATSCKNQFDYFWQNHDYSNGGTQRPPQYTSGGVAGPHLSLGKMALKVNSLDPQSQVVISYVRFSFQRNPMTDSTYTYTMGGDALATTWRWINRLPQNPALPKDYTTRATTDWNGTVNGHLSDCEILIPNISIEHAHVSGIGVIDVSVYAIEQDSKGLEKPLFWTGTITFNWLGIQ